MSVSQLMLESPTQGLLSEASRPGTAAAGMTSCQMPL